MPPCRRPVALWALLVLLSVLLAAAFEWMRLAAALLLGPMLAGIVVAAGLAPVAVPRPLFWLAQGVIGAMMGRVITLPILSAMLRDWPLFLLSIGAVIAAGMALGWLLARWRVLPGSSAVWGFFPGAALAMALMAEAFGEDIRLVAFMQYLRVALVTLAASAVAQLWGEGTAATTATDWLGPVDGAALAGTLAVIVAGVGLGWRLRSPSAPLLVPMVAAAALGDAGVLTITLPPWLLAGSYAVVGWGIGLRFTRTTVRHVLRALPRITVAIVVLIGICGGMAALLAAVSELDPLTAYLAMCPGGADAVAIIAASSHVDMPFVVAMQTGRFLVLVFTGPLLARLVARHALPAGRGAG
ncbi:AbrB family transcriptional regulator [Rhodovastum atsumiense]|uniref:AbrB family transcriptional regulator n=1 Tax=Rhodovastum atsumiense TaxID=504468 RepID=UPI001EF06B86|nr:AbrB family transcriptional regulator [Rhodovastum atsumiense]